MYCKFFDPICSWTWYVTEGEETDNDDFLFFGFIVGFEAEPGYFMLSQLESAKHDIRGLQRISIERDS
ncbi:MAG: DUF2958 domain-containing protein [Candidatus Levyibacteriota bacterium]